MGWPKGKKRGPRVIRLGGALPLPRGVLQTPENKGLSGQPDKVQLNPPKSRACSPKPPPVVGLPRTAPDGSALAWVSVSDPITIPLVKCSACGKFTADTVVLCGRCTCILSDTMGPQVLKALTPKEKLLLQRRVARKERNG